MTLHKPIIRLSMAAMLFLSGGPAVQAQDYAHVSSLTNKELLRLCRSDAPDGVSARSVSLTPCTTYILGVADQLSIDKQFCLSSPDYALKVINEVTGYLRRHEELGAQPPALAIRKALSDAFPCEDAQPATQD